MHGAPVDREQHVAGDRLVARFGVRQGAVGAGRDDRGEARRFGAEPAHAQLQGDRDVALGAPHQPVFEDGAQRLVGELARGADRARSLPRP